MFGYPPFTRDQRIGTALTVVGTLIVFITDRHLLYQQWGTYLPPAGGLLLCAMGVYFNTRRRSRQE
jgi:hypothetical protein